jgi:hypothetical protein
MRVYIFLIVLDLACYFGIYALIKDHPSAGWVFALIILYGWTNWFQGRVKRDEYE